MSRAMEGNDVLRFVTFNDHIRGFLPTNQIELANYKENQTTARQLTKLEFKMSGIRFKKKGDLGELLKDIAQKLVKLHEL